MKTIVYHGIGSNSLGSLNTSSFSVETEDGKWLLVDCGPDTPRQFKTLGVPFSQLQTVVLTHSHLDHCGGIPYLLFGRNLDIIAAKGTEAARPEDQFSLTLICEPGLGNRLKDLFHFCHPEVKLLYEIRVLDIRLFLKEPLNLESHSLRFSLGDHAVPTYSMRLDDKSGRSLAYSSDTLPCDAFVDLASNCDTIIHEAMFPAGSTAGEKTKHSTTANAAEVIKRVKPRQKAFMMHIHPPQYANRQRLESQASEIAGMLVSYPDEGSKQTF